MKTIDIILTTRHQGVKWDLSNDVESWQGSYSSESLGILWCTAYSKYVFAAAMKGKLWLTNAKTYRSHSNTNTMVWCRKRCFKQKSGWCFMHKQIWHQQDIGVRCDMKCRIPRKSISDWFCLSQACQQCSFTSFNVDCVSENLITYTARYLATYITAKTYI